MYMCVKCVYACARIYACGYKHTHTHIHTCMQRAPAIARHAPLRFHYCICNCGTWTPEGASLPAFHAKVRGGWEYIFCLPAFYAKVRHTPTQKPAIYAWTLLKAFFILPALYARTRGIRGFHCQRFTPRSMNTQKREFELKCLHRQNGSCAGACANDECTRMNDDHCKHRSILAA